MTSTHPQGALPISTEASGGGMSTGIAAIPRMSAMDVVTDQRLGQDTGIIIDYECMNYLHRTSTTH